MKAIITLLVLTMCFPCVGNPVIRTSHKKAPLQGKVKLVRSCVYATLREDDARTRPFDKDDYIVDSFSKTGLKVYSHWIVKGIITGVTKYKYDSKGNKIEERWYDKDGVEGEWRLFSYDTLGSLLEENVYRPGVKEAFNTVKYTYESSRIATKERVGMETSTYFYNDKGQVVREETKSIGHEGKLIDEYTYDDKGRLRSERSSTDKHSLITTYTYDKHDNEVLAEQRFRPEEVERSFVSEYIYDDNGNWIRCITDNEDTSWEGDRLKNKMIREISYY